MNASKNRANEGLQAIMDASQEITNYLRYHSVHLVQSVNHFGKQQTSFEIKSDKIISNHLTASGLGWVHSYLQEERPLINKVNKDG